MRVLPKNFRRQKSLLSPRPSPARPSASGFTLVELLVVIAIIGILATLLMPAVLQALREAESTQCKSSLKTIGAAVQAFKADHDDYYPPGRVPTDLDSSPGIDGNPRYWGLWTGVTQNRWSKDRQLGSHVKTYVGAADKERSPVFCKAAIKVVPDSDLTRSYIVNHRNLEGKWGHSAWGTVGNPTNNPKRTTDVQGPARLWAVQDADQLQTDINPGWSTYPYFPPVVVHGRRRNTLFFDYHVEETPAELANLP